MLGQGECGTGIITDSHQLQPTVRVHCRGLWSQKPSEITAVHSGLLHNIPTCKPTYSAIRERAYTGLSDTASKSFRVFVPERLQGRLRPIAEIHPSRVVQNVGS